MSHEVSLPSNPIELRCPNCGEVVGQSVMEQEAPLCRDCVRLEKAVAPVREAIARIEAWIAAQDEKARQLEQQRLQTLEQMGEETKRLAQWFGYT